jgi:hypothetical protein
MNSFIAVDTKHKGLVKNSSLILIAFATAFFPRILSSVGIPSFVNFLHFALVPLACGIILFTTRVKNQNQISISKALLAGLFILLGVMTTSALLNRAGLINVFVGYLLLAEPFILLLAIISVPFSAESLKKFKRWVLAFALTHLLLAFGQWFLVTFGSLYQGHMTREDNVQGVFYLTGSGHVVGASVSMSFGLYYFVSARSAPKWLRISVLVGAFYHLLLADAKQVLLVWLAAWFILILVKLNDIQATLKYVIAAILVGYTFLWCLENVAMFSAFNTWIRPELYGPDGEGTLMKTSSIRIICSYYQSFLNWLFGLGPGHTVGRLGGWMLKDYANLLQPLGATIHPASEAVWEVRRGHWLDSSFFSPFWGWVGIWGDSGFLGLGAYLYLCSIVWRRICLDDFPRFQMLTVMIYGLIFTQMEEPGYMLSVASIIGLRWQEQRIAKATRQQALHLNAQPSIY